MPLGERGEAQTSNGLRYAGRPGHVESYFLRANDPTRPRAVWLKATVFAPVHGDAQIESWLVYFDGERPAPVGGHETTRLRLGAFTEAADGVRVSACRMVLDLGAHGRATGEIETNVGAARVDLSWEPSTSPVAEPLVMLRSRVLREGPFPRSKLLTPFPSLRFSGAIEVGGERIEVADWSGMQGHNWGREHAFEYAWGQCLFPATAIEPEAMLEGFSARVRVGQALTPRVSCLVVRSGEHTLRFDRLFDLWRQDAALSKDRWTLTMTGIDGEARLEMDATDRPVACLGYRNPDGRLSYCLNSKLARVRLMVQPRRGAAFARESAHGGALEFLQSHPDARFPDVL